MTTTSKISVERLRVVLRWLARWTTRKSEGSEGYAIGLGFCLPFRAYASYLRATDGEWRWQGKKVPAIWARLHEKCKGVVIYLGVHRLSLWIARKPTKNGVECLVAHPGNYDQST